MAFGRIGFRRVGLILALPPRLGPPGRSVASGEVSEGGVVVDRGLLVTLVAKPGLEQALSDFLTGALPLARAEAGTITWYAVRIDDRTYGIFDTFNDENARQAHLDGPIAAGLMAKADDLLAEPPSIRPIDILAAK